MHPMLEELSNDHAPAIGKPETTVAVRIAAEGEHIMPDTITKFQTGAVRSADADDVRYDLITPVGLRRLAETCAEGAHKYGDFNWQQGIPASQMLNHAIRHIYLWLEGDRSEDHLAHSAWNILGVCHFEELKPDMIDVPARKEMQDA